MVQYGLLFRSFWLHPGSGPLQPGNPFLICFRFLSQVFHLLVTVKASSPIKLGAAILSEGSPSVAFFLDCVCFISAVTADSDQCPTEHSVMLARDAEIS